MALDRDLAIRRILEPGGIRGRVHARVAEAIPELSPPTMTSETPQTQSSNLTTMLVNMCQDSLAFRS
jgi:hypothetical protein